MVIERFQERDVVRVVSLREWWEAADDPLVGREALFAGYLYPNDAGTGAGAGRCGAPNYRSMISQSARYRSNAA